MSRTINEFEDVTRYAAPMESAAESSDAFPYSEGGDARRAYLGALRQAWLKASWETVLVLRRHPFSCQDYFHAKERESRAWELYRRKTLLAAQENG